MRSSFGAGKVVLKVMIFMLKNQMSKVATNGIKSHFALYIMCTRKALE